MNHMPGTRFITFLSILAVATIVLFAPNAYAEEVGHVAGARPIKDRYIVRVKTDQVSSVDFAAHEIANRFHGKVHRVWEGVNSFELEIDDVKAAQIREVSFVEFIEQDQEMDPPRR